jgi:hypothetical protein
VHCAVLHIISLARQDSITHEILQENTGIEEPPNDDATDVVETNQNFIVRTTYSNK